MLQISSSSDQEHSPGKGTTPCIEIFQIVPRATIRLAWPMIEGYLKKALERYPSDGIRIEHVKQKCEAGKFQLHVVMQGDDFLGAICTRVGEFGKYHVLGLGGRNLKAWVGILDKYIREEAKAHGCHIIGGYGRRGWLKALNITPRELYSWELDI